MGIRIGIWVLVWLVLGLTPRAYGLRGQVLSLDGAGDCLEIADTPSLHSAAAVTVTAWFRLDAGYPSWQALFWKGDLPDRSPWKNREFGVYLHSRGYAHLCSTPVSRLHVGQLYVDTPGGMVQPGQWYHLAAVLSSSDNYMKIYLNGDLVASRPYDRSGVRDSAGPLWVGGIPHRGADFHGVVDEVRVWGRALPPGEIRHNMNRALAGDEEALMAYFTFDSVNEDGLIRDHTRNRHHGRLRGGAHLETIQVLMPPVTAAPDRQRSALVTRPRAPVVTTTTTTTAASAQSGDAGTTTTTTTTRVPVVVPPAGPAPVAVEGGGAIPTALVHAGPVPSIAGDAAYLLIQALGSSDMVVRRRAAEGLDRLHPSVFVPVMKVALQSRDLGVRRRAAEVLVSMSPESREPWSREEIERDAMVVRGQTVEALTQAVAATLEKRHAGKGEAEETRHPERYRGWEHKWATERPGLWDLETRGLVARYDRAEGLFAGWRMPRTYSQQRVLTHYGEAGYSFYREDWRYQAGGEVFTFYGLPREGTNLVTVGAEVHDLTDSQDGWLISEEENSLHAALFRRDYRDYYQRTGWSVYSGHNIGGVLQVTGRYSREEFFSMATGVDWALVDSRFTRNAFRPNPAVDEGEISSARADLQLDTRDRRNRPWQGWLINALFERAGGIFEGDHQYKRYLLDLRRYQPIGLGTRLDLRLRSGSAKGQLPRQYRYDLGGLSTLRGYGFKSFTGDRMLLVNLEYWVDGDRHFAGDLPVDGLGLAVFFDAGSAWFAGDLSDPFDHFTDLLEATASDPVEATASDPMAATASDRPRLRRSVGFGIGTTDDGFRINIAHPLDADGDPWRLSARFSRSF